MYKYRVPRVAHKRSLAAETQKDTNQFLPITADWFLNSFHRDTQTFVTDTCRFWVLIGNNGAMHFNAYPEPYNHAHSIHVYF